MNDNLTYTEDLHFTKSRWKWVYSAILVATVFFGHFLFLDWFHLQLDDIRISSQLFCFVLTTVLFVLIDNILFKFKNTKIGYLLLFVYTCSFGVLLLALYCYQLMHISHSVADTLEPFVFSALNIFMVYLSERFISRRFLSRGRLKKKKR
jgi:hypothetical protein